MESMLLLHVRTELNTRYTFCYEGRKAHANHSLISQSSFVQHVVFVTAERRVW